MMSMISVKLVTLQNHFLFNTIHLNFIMMQFIIKPGTEVAAIFWNMISYNNWTKNMWKLFNGKTFKDLHKD